MTRRQLTDPFGSDDEDERFVSKWMRLSNMYISVTFIFLFQTTSLIANTQSY